MRTEWHFYYELRDYAFGKVRRYRGGPGVSDDGVVQMPKFDLKVVPDSAPKFPGASETGQVHIEMPGRQTDTKESALSAVVLFSQRIEFNHGPMKVHAAFVTGKHIPETPAEEQEVKDEPYFAEMKLVEWQPPQDVPEGALGDLLSTPKTARLISTFNAARATKNPIDKFTGYFKVLEDIYCKSKNGKPLRALKSSKVLFDIAYDSLRITRGEKACQLTRPDFNQLLFDIVSARDQCSHLRSDIGLGIAPNDARVRVEVEPLLPALEDLARGSIRKAEGGNA